MEIKYLGHSSFLIKTKDAKLLTDPFDPKMLGLPFAKVETDIVTFSHAHGDHAFRDGVKNPETALMLDWPGEYEKKNVRVFGFPTHHDDKKSAERGENVIYKIEAEDMSILHLGDLGHLLDEATIEAIGTIDILMIPVGGFYTIDADQAVKVINSIEPSIVLPMHFQVPNMEPSLSQNLKPVSEFLGKIGAKDVAPIEKLV